MIKDYAKMHGALAGEISYLAVKIKYGNFTREEIADMLDALISVKEVAEPEAPSPVVLFHRKRGCCDGLNPSECHAYRVEAAKPRNERTPTDRRALRNEYFGTGPND